MSDWKLTELHSAAFNCDLEWFQQRITAGDDVNARDSNGYTPLHWVAVRSMVGGEPEKMSEVLINKGADVNAKINQKFTYTALHLAIDLRNKSLVAFLIDKGADVNLDADGVTPLMTAARTGDEEIVKLLIERGANVEQKCGSFTAFHYAEFTGQEHLFNLLRH